MFLFSRSVNGQSDAVAEVERQHSNERVYASCVRTCTHVVVCTFGVGSRKSRSRLQCHILRAQSVYYYYYYFYPPNKRQCTYLYIYIICAMYKYACRRLNIYLWGTYAMRGGDDVTPTLRLTRLVHVCVCTVCMLLQPHTRARTVHGS